MIKNVERDTYSLQIGNFYFKLPLADVLHVCLEYKICILHVLYTVHEIGDWDCRKTCSKDLVTQSFARIQARKS